MTKYRAIDVVQKVAPNARREYIMAFSEGDHLLQEAGIMDATGGFGNGLRLAHFLAQNCHESGGLKIVRESMNYSAKRIMEIFGVDRHSAAVTQVEAKQLAGNEYALAERVYGLGNPSKAKELGNVKPGDGFRYRGNGPGQITGREAHRILGQMCDVGTLFEDNPEIVTSAKYALMPSVMEWKQKKCNTLADKNDINGITKKINGGLNGLSDRVSWFNKIWKVIQEFENNDGEIKPSWSVAKSDPKIMQLQRNLNTLGAVPKLNIDGLYGTETTKAVLSFQKANGLREDGVADDMVFTAIATRLNNLHAGSPTPTVTQPPVKETISGGSLIIASEGVKQATDAIAPYADLSDYIRWGMLGLTVIGGLILAYGVITRYVIPMFKKSTANLAVPQ